MIQNDSCKFRWQQQKTEVEEYMVLLEEGFKKAIEKKTREKR
jgi:hypothetical protein